MANNIPELRFSEFSESWVKKKLGEVVEKIGSGKTPKGGVNVYTKTGIPFIRSQNVNSDKLTLDETHISEDIHAKMKGSKVQSNDILLNITGASIGRSCVVPKDFIEGNVNQHVCIIRLREGNSNFYQSILSSSQGQKLILQGQTGSGREGLNFKSIRNFKFVIPNSPTEQTKIATFLTAVDKRINLLQKKKGELEQYKKGVMKKLFSQTLRFKNDNDSHFENWEEKSLGEIGKTFNGLTGKTKVDFGKGKPYIQYMQIFSNSRIDVSNFGLVDVGEDENQSKAQFGDVFFTTSSETPNEIGMSSVLTEQVEDVYLNSFCFGYRPNSLEELVPEFSQFFFRSSKVRKEIIKLAQGSTRFNMSKVAFMKLKFDFPKKDEQQKIANFLSSIDKSIENISNQIDDSVVFKKGLLQKMFV